MASSNFNKFNSFEYINNLVPYPACKFVNIHTILPDISTGFQDSVLDSLKYSVKELASHLIIRGQPSSLFEWTDRLSPKFQRKLSPSLLGFSSVMGVEKETSYCMARNSGGRVVEYMDELLERGERLNGAFMHWYKRVDEGFEDVYGESVECLQGVLDAYKM